MLEFIRVNIKCLMQSKQIKQESGRLEFLRRITWMLDRADNIFWEDNLRVDLIGEPKIASLSTWIGP